MLTMNKHGTEFFIFYSVKSFMFTANPERLSSLSVLWINVAIVFVNLSGLHAEVSKQIWN